MEARERLIVALDFGDIDEAISLVDSLGDEILWYKVGLELFFASGRAAVDALRERGKKVFLDLKLHDIPNTVERAARVLAGLGAQIINVHALAGEAALAGAARALAGASDPPLLAAVTVLTSTPGDAQVVAQRVLDLASMASRAGAGAVVVPFPALRALKEALPGMRTIVPGIRLEGDSLDDQRQIATPSRALEAGADWIVVGRSITRTLDPLERARAILQQAEAALSGN